MATIRTTYKYKCDLDKGTLETSLRNSLMQADALADAFAVTVQRNGADVDISGMTVYGYLYANATQSTVPIKGTVSSSTATVILSEDCYAVPGYASLMIQLHDGDVRHTVLKVDFVVTRTGGTLVLDGDNVLPTLAELLGQISAMEQATAEAREAAAAADAAREGIQGDLAALTEENASLMDATINNTEAYSDQLCNSAMWINGLYSDEITTGIKTVIRTKQLVQGKAGGKIVVKPNGLYVRVERYVKENGVFVKEGVSSNWNNADYEVGIFDNRYYGIMAATASSSGDRASIAPADLTSEVLVYSQYAYVNCYTKAEVDDKLSAVEKNIAGLDSKTNVITQIVGAGEAKVNIIAGELWAVDADGIATVNKHDLRCRASVPVIGFDGGQVMLVKSAGVTSGTEYRMICSTVNDATGEVTTGGWSSAAVMLQSGMTYYFSIRDNAGIATAEQIAADVANGYISIEINLSEKIEVEYEENADRLKVYVDDHADSDTIVICAAADNHYNDHDWKDRNQTRYAKNIAGIAKKINADFITVLGDMIEGYNDHLPVDGYTQQYVHNRRMQEMVEAFTATGMPFIYVAGHHECYPISATELDSANATLDSGAEFVQHRAFYTPELKAITFGTGEQRRYEDTGNRQGYRMMYGKNLVDISDPNMDVSTQTMTGGSSLTYYFDIAKATNTVRFVVLDGTHFTTYGYHPDTVAFVANALNDAAAKGYKVIIFNHIQLRNGAYNQEGTFTARNEAALIDAIKGSNANVLAYIHGHVHSDNIVYPDTVNNAGETPYSDLSFPLVAISCQKIYGGTGDTPIGNPVNYGTRAVGTYSEYCMDTILVHADTGTIEFCRFGAGDTGAYPTRAVNK